MQTRVIEKLFAAVMLGATCCAPVMAEDTPAATNSQSETPAVDELRNTLVGVLQALVQKGLLTNEQAQSIVADAQAKAQAQAKGRAAAKAKQEAEEKDAVRVTYVPQIVRDEISKQVSKEVAPEVTSQVLDSAKKQGWGIPGALPEWIKNVRLYGDLRVREEQDTFANDNAPQQPNYQAINTAGGASKAGVNAFLNTTEDRTRTRIRLRVGMDARVTDGLTAGIRLATGSLAEPISTNQTLGQTGNRYVFAVDQAYLRYDARSDYSLPWMSLWLGRMPNPWVYSDLVWDPDLQFEGIATTWRLPYGDKQSPSDLFLTAGAFPLQEIELSSRDKWLYGGQLGWHVPWTNDGKLTLAVGYYQFSHITGQLNEPNSTLLNYTAPQFMQKGNTVFDIINHSGSSTDANLYALAAAYRELNATAIAKIPAFGHAFTVTADYVHNLGYNQKDVLAKSGYTSIDQVTDPTQRLAFDKMVDGYRLEVGFGSQNTGKRGTWRASADYKYLERDAVVDAFTDSDFHLGGTNAKGYILRADYWIVDRTSLTLRYISSDEIRHTGTPYTNNLGQTEIPTDSPRFGVDILFFDVNAEF